jgi:hypothetical protein
VFEEQKPPLEFGKTTATLPPRLFRFVASRRGSS